MAGGAHQHSPARRAALQLHRWLGLSAGLLLIAMAVTGAGMVFRGQLEPVTSAQLLRASACAAEQPAPLPPSQLVAAARGSASGAGAAGTPAAIRLYADPSASARVLFSDGRWIYLAPCSGWVLGARDAYGGGFGTVAWIHIAGYADGGNWIAGLAALAAIALGVAGLVLWRPGTRRGTASRQRVRAMPMLAPAARRRRFHRSLAPWAAPVIILLALTGLPQAFSSLAAALDRPVRVASALPRTAAAQQHNYSPVALDAAWRLATAAPWRQMQWRLPRAAGDAIVLELVAADAAHAYAAGLIHFDAATGQVLRRVDYGNSALGRKLYLWALALHYGSVDSLAWQLALFLAALSVPVLAWTGIAAWAAARKDMRQPPQLEMVLLEKRLAAEGICTFVLAAPRGRKLPSWSAGAHIDVHLPNGLVRQYSLCGDPQDRRRYQIAVQRCTPSRGGSQAMHESLQAGDRLRLGLPRNHFPLVPGAAHSVLLAGGIGITPILAMAEALAAQGASFELHYCVRSHGHAAFTGRLAHHQCVHFHISSEGGKADLDRLLSAAPAGAHLYICGPAGFTDAALAAAARQSWPAEAVHTERFAAAPAGRAGDAAFDLVIASSGQLVRVAAGQTALDALHAAGVAVPDSCRQGLCGSCITGVLEGQPDHRDHCLDTQTRQANDCFTPCCSRARSARLVLDL